MKVWPTILVLVLAAIGVSAVAYFEKSERGGPSDPAATGRLLDPAAFPIDEVRRIALQRKGEAPMVFAVDERGWSQIEPYFHPMDPFSIRQFAELASRLEAIDKLVPDQGDAPDTAGLGLDPPQATLTFDWPDGSLTVLFGRRGIAGRAYLQMAGDDAVYVVGQDLHDRAVEMEPLEWRDRRIFHDVGVESERIVRAEGEQRIVFQRDRRAWIMTEPVRTRINPPALDEFFQALGRAIVDGFLLDQPDAEALAKFGLDQPVATVEIVTNRPTLVGDEIVREPETQRLLVGATIGVGSLERFAMIEGRPVVVQLSVPTLQALFTNIRNLIDPTPSGVETADVKSIVIRGPGGELELRRELERWIAPEAGADGADVNVHGPYVDELLQQLTELRAPVVELQEYPRDLEVATITLYGFGRRPLDTVRIAREPETGRIAMENGDNVLRIFGESVTIRLTPEAFGIPVDGQ